MLCKHVYKKIPKGCSFPSIFGLQRGFAVERFRMSVSKPVGKHCLIEFEWKMSVGGGRLIGVD